MNYKIIDFNEYKRIDHFHYFNSLTYPYVGVTCEVELTSFYHLVKEKKLPFFLTLLWCVNRACNDVKEFRQRILNNQIIEYDYCPTSHTVAKKDDTYAYCTLDARSHLKDYLKEAVPVHETAKKAGTIEESSEDALPLIFISTLPWLNYTSLIQPVPMPADSNPRITWGKAVEKDNRVLIPVSVLCHHALVDGKQIAEFYERLSTQIQEAIHEIKSI